MLLLAVPLRSGAASGEPLEIDINNRTNPTDETERTQEIARFNDLGFQRMRRAWGFADS
jgi:hypothetical protein